MSQNIIYLKADQSVSLNKRKVCIEDIVTVYCSDPGIMTDVKKIKLFSFPNEKNVRETISILKIVQEINKRYPENQICNLGKEDIVVYYKKTQGSKKWVTTLKVVFICFTLFFGAGISVMGYNNDVDLNKVFSKIYFLTTGIKTKEPNIMHLCYALGLFLGMIVFFNHASQKRLSDEPTPVEVQMRVYEDNVNQAVIVGSSRKEEEMDADS